MPIYAYICNECGTHFEKSLSVTENLDQQACPKGHPSVRRVFSPPGIVFKGSGWYSTDHRAKPKSSLEA